MKATPQEEILAQKERVWADARRGGQAHARVFFHIDLSTVRLRGVKEADLAVKQVSWGRRTMSRTTIRNALRYLLNRRLIHRDVRGAYWVEGNP